MTQRRSALAGAAACTLAFAFSSTAFAQAAPSEISSSSSLTLTLPGASSANAPTGAASETSPRRHYHRRSSRHSLQSRRLPSRGMTSEIGQPTSIVGRVGLVISDQAAIVAGRERMGRVLSVCPKGQYLAVNGETTTQYAVLMIDHSVGYVAKSDVQLLNYQAVANPSAAPGQDSASPSGGLVAGSLGQRLVQTAQTYLGVSYVWGGNTQDGIDCSGFVKAVYAANGMSLPRHSGDQAMVGYDVPRDDWSKWVPGDRMYFACHHPEIDHTGMYIGGGYFIHASVGHGRKVDVDRVDNAYYSKHLVAVRRSPELVGEQPTASPLSQTASSQSADPEAGQQ